MTDGICKYCGQTRKPLEIGRRIVAYRPCDCDEAQAERELLEQEERSRVQTEQAKLLRNKYEIAGIKRRFIDSEVDCESFLATIHQGTGLYIVGDVGTGKTSLASSIAKGLVASGKHVKVKSSLEVLTLFRSTYRSTISESEVRSSILSCDVLVIDDLGKEQASEWVLSVLFDLVNACYENNRPLLIITSQYQRSKLLERYTKKSGDETTARAVVSRLTELCRKIELSGCDRRLFGHEKTSGRSG